jgi:hypothetical protein
MTDDADDLVRHVHFANEIRHRSVTPQFIGRPPTRNDETKKIRVLERLDPDSWRYLEPMLTANRVEIETGAHNIRPPFFEPHERHIVLEVFHTLSNEDSDPFASEFHGSCQCNRRAPVNSIELKTSDWKVRGSRTFQSDGLFQWLEHVTGNIVPYQFALAEPSLCCVPEMESNVYT